jgi:hypothetical protein
MQIRDLLEVGVEGEQVTTSDEGRGCDPNVVRGDRRAGAPEICEDLAVALGHVAIDAEHLDERLAQKLIQRLLVLPASRPE